jgi:drug/metabolite transporter (DMT)-like permease
MSPSPTVAYVGLAAAALCWASAFIAGKFALAEMTPLTVAAWRYVFAVAMLVPFALRRGAWQGIGAYPGRLAFMVVCGGVLYPGLFLAALSRTSATNTSLLIALNPTLTALLAPLAGERIDPRRLPGVLLALLGAALVITRGDPGRLHELGHHSGDLLAIVAAFCWVGFNLASRRVVGRAQPAPINLVVYGIGALALFALTWTEEPLRQFVHASPAAIAGVVVMAALSSALAGQLFLIGVRTVGVTRSAVFVNFVPVLTATLAALVLGERMEDGQALGGAAVLAGVWWTTRRAAPVAREAPTVQSAQRNSLTATVPDA